VATVVRTISVTAAKPGAKAIISADGEVIEGWIGGGCARHAVLQAAIKSIADGEPRLVSLQPEELLKEQGLTAGDEQDGVVNANNMCPSRGSMDIFIEPVLSDPELLVFGTSPVANMLVELAKPFAFNVVQAYDDTDNTSADKCYVSYNEITAENNHRYIVVATQGSGDLKALQTALTLPAQNISLVASSRKTEHLKESLQSAGANHSAIEKIKGPAGLDIGGVTPQEIALSILAEIIALRRQKPADDNTL